MTAFTSGLLVIDCLKNCLKNDLKAGPYGSNKTRATGVNTTYNFTFSSGHFKKVKRGASLVAQWLRVCLPMQGTWVRALVWEDPTCRRATGPVSHNYWACASGACAPQREAAIVRGPRTAMKSGPHLPQLEKALAEKWRPNTAKNK